MIDCTSVEDLLERIEDEETDVRLFNVDMTLDSQILDELYEAIGSSASLEYLHLQNNNMNSDIAVKLADSIAKNKSIEHLTICQNNMCDEGAKAFANALKRNESLEMISFAYNAIGDSAAIALANVLKNRVVFDLTLTVNKITEVGAKALDCVVQANPGVRINYEMKSEAAKTICGERKKYAEKLLDLYQKNPFNDFTMSELIGYDINKYAIYWLNANLDEEDMIDFPLFERNISNKICELYSIVVFVLKQHMSMDLVKYTVCFWAQLPFTVKPEISNLPDLPKSQIQEEMVLNRNI